MNHKPFTHLPHDQNTPTKFLSFNSRGKPTGCGEPLLEAPNYELGAFEEVVQSKSKKSPTYTIQTSKGKDWKRVSKVKADPFTWLILFQPELNQEEEVIT